MQTAAALNIQFLLSDWSVVCSVRARMWANPTASVLNVVRDYSMSTDQLLWRLKQAFEVESVVTQHAQLAENTLTASIDSSQGMFLAERTLTFERGHH